MAFDRQPPWIQDLSSLGVSQGLGLIRLLHLKFTLRLVSCCVRDMKGLTHGVEILNSNCSCAVLTGDVEARFLGYFHSMY
jgi:hypothetical protein